MRRLAVAALAVVLMGIAVSAAATETDNYNDKFQSIGWGGSDGSLHWSGPWSEIGDDGDEKKGNVRVVSSGNCASGNCIRMSALTTLLGSIGAVRRADTSDLTDTSLSFDLKATPSLLGSQLAVQVNVGGGWATVADYQLGPGLTDHPTIDVSGFRSESFRVRFLFSGVLLSSEAYIDDVEVLGTIIEEPTTTTTTTTPTTTPTVPSTTTTTVAATTSTQVPASPTTTGTWLTATTAGGGGGPTTPTTIAITTTSTTAGASEDPDRELSVTFPGGTTSTTTTTTALVEAIGAPGSDDDGTPRDGSGIRAAARGIQASFQGDLYGEVRTVSSLNRVDFQAKYTMAVEVIEATWGWMVLLGILIAYSIIKGLDRRRGDLDS